MADYYTVAEVAEKLGKRPKTIRRWIKEGKLKGRKINGDYGILPKDLEEFLNPTPKESSNNTNDVSELEKVEAETKLVLAQIELDEAKGLRLIPDALKDIEGFLRTIEYAQNEKAFELDAREVAVVKGEEGLELLQASLNTAQQTLEIRETNIERSESAVTVREENVETKVAGHIEDLSARNTKVREREEAFRGKLAGGMNELMESGKTLRLPLKTSRILSSLESLTGLLNFTTNCQNLWIGGNGNDYQF
jgi:excisionase family DNA binding protein